MQLYIVLAIIGVIWSAGITTTGYIKGHAAGVKVTKNKYEGEISKQKEEAARIIATETANVAATEKKLQETKDQQEVTDATNQKKINTLSNSVRLLSGALGRMRDPHAGRGQGSSGPQGAASAGAGNRADNGSETGGLLSAKLTEFLQRTTREADEINQAYASCRDDSFSVRAALPGRK